MLLLVVSVTGSAAFGGEFDTGSAAFGGEFDTDCANSEESICTDYE